MPKIGVWCLRYFLRRTGRPRNCGPVPLRPRVATGLLLSENTFSDLLKELKDVRKDSRTGILSQDKLKQIKTIL
jgi:hypothetical protein